MPVYKQVEESHWCPGPWPWQWFRQCKEYPWKWEYQFWWVVQKSYGIGADKEGCELGRKYNWEEDGIFRPGTSYFGPTTQHFDSRLHDEGPCGFSDATSHLSIVPIEDSIHVTATMEEVNTFITHKETYIPDSEICNPTREYITTWIITKNFEITLIPDNQIGYMTWSIDNHILVGPKGIITIPNKEVYFVNDESTVLSSINLSFSISDNNVLTIQSDGNEGNYSIAVALTVKVLNVIGEIGVVVFSKKFFLNAQSKDGDENYHKFLGCNEKVKSLIDGYRQQIIIPPIKPPKVEDPIGDLNPPIDHINWINEINNAFSNDLKNISYEYSIRLADS